MNAQLIRLNLRFNRMTIIWWCLGLWAFLAVTPPAYLQYYPTLEERAPLVEGMRETLGTKAMYGLFPPPGTIGQFTTWETGALLCILSSTMAVLIFTSMHRGAEARGEAELIQSMGLPRSTIHHAALLSSILVATLTGLGSTLILITLHYVSTDEISLAGSVAFGLMITVTMIGFIGVTSILQSLFGHATNMLRLGLVSIAVAFLLRMFADTYDSNFSSAFNWISPLGWRTHILPFTNDDWTALGVAALITGGLLIAAVILNSSREVNASLVPQRVQKGRAPRTIRGLISLNLLTHRGAIIAWSLTCGVIIASILPLVDSMIPLLEQDEATLNILQDLLPLENLQSEFIIYIFQMVAVLVSVAVVQPLVFYMSQERSRLVDTVRATGTRRSTPLAGAVATALLTGLACAILSIIGGLIALQIQGGEMVDGMELVFASALSMIPQTLVFVGLATVCAGWLPRFIHLSWLPVVLAGVVSILGPLLTLTPEQVDLSPLSHTITPSGDGLGALALFSALGLVGIILGIIGSERREIP